MSAIDPDKEPAAARGMRIVEAPPDDPASESDEKDRRPIEILRCSYRPPDADFYCWKYGVWYNLMDCCARHQENTYEGCGDCGQGRNNLKANLERYRVDLKRRTQFGPRSF